MQAAGYDVVVYCWDRSGRNYPAAPGDLEAGSVRVAAPHGTNRLGLFLPRYYAALAGALKERGGADILHCAHLCLVPFALDRARRTGARVVYDAFEFHALNIAQRFPVARPFVRGALEGLEQWACARLDGVLTVDSVAGMLENRYRRACSNTAVLWNVPDLSITPDRSALARFRQRYWRRRLLVYAGGLFSAKGASLFAPLLARLAGDFPDLVLAVAGEGPDSDWQHRAAALGVLDRLDLLGWQPYPQLLALLSCADVGLALFDSTEPRLTMLGRGPRKVFDYMRMGIPVIGPPLPGIGDLIREEACGVVVDCSDADKVAGAVRELLVDVAAAKQMGNRGAAAVRERYNWRLEEPKLLAVYERMGVSM